jgi:hypothetical protein
LQLQQGEFRRHQFENHGTVFDLGAQPRDSGCENAAVIAGHGPAGNDGRGICPVTHGFRNQAGLVQQFIALQYQFLVPFALIEAERDGDALPAFALQACSAC